jgi:tetratricopeptide (TPR) repeat protein
VLEEAYALARGTADRSLRARTSCALATALARGDDLPRAEELLREGLEEVGGDPEYTLDRVFCLYRGSAVARNAGDANTGVARIEEGLRLLQQFPSDFQEVDLSGLTELAEAMRIAGRLHEASAAFEQAYARSVALGRDESQGTGTLLNNWALTLSSLGRPLDAEPLFRRAIEISRADATEDAVSPMLLVNYARVLRDLARLDEADDYVTRGVAKARAADDQIVVNQGLLLAAWVHLNRNQLDRAAAVLSEVEPRLRQALPAGHIAFASLASYRSLLALGRGDLQAALPLAQEAVSLAEASIQAGGQGSDFLPTMLLRRSDLERRLGRPRRGSCSAAWGGRGWRWRTACATSVVETRRTRSFAPRWNTCKARSARSTPRPSPPRSFCRAPRVADALAKPARG